MITIDEWKKKRYAYLKKIEMNDIPEEEWQAFMDELCPTVDHNLPQSRSVQLPIIAYPTIFDFIKDDLGRGKLKSKIVGSFHLAGFYCNINDMSIAPPYFTISCIIGEGR